MALARDDLAGWAEAARSVLAPLPDTAARAVLESLCDLVVSRTA
jgi:hypothetical protein